MNDEKPNIEVVKELIKNRASWHRQHVKRCQEADRYYRNENDILKRGVRGQDSGPLRSADNRIPRNFHGLLVNQKAAYMFAAPPLFDIGKEEVNKRIADVLGDSYPKICKDLCVNASNQARKSPSGNTGIMKDATATTVQAAPFPLLAFLNTMFFRGFQKKELLKKEISFFMVGVKFPLSLLITTTYQPMTW